MIIHILRVQEIRERRWWLCIGGQTGTLHKTRKSKVKALLAMKKKYEPKFGNLEQITKYRGVASMAEAAASVTDIMLEKLETSNNKEKKDMNRKEMTLEWMKTEVTRTENAIYKAYTMIELTGRMKELGLAIAADIDKKTAVSYYIKGLKKAIETEETAEKPVPVDKPCYRCKGQVTEFKGVKRCEECGQDQADEKKAGKKKTGKKAGKKGGKKKQEKKENTKSNKKAGKKSKLLLFNIDKRFRTKSEKDDLKADLLKQGPYTKKQLKDASWWATKMLASALEVEVFGKDRDTIIKNIVKGQK